MSEFQFNDKIDALQTTLSNANSTLASYDLSSNMSTRVQTIRQINPNLLMDFQASSFPAIAIRIDSLEVEHNEMARNSTNAKKEGTCRFEIVGMVFESGYDSDKDLSDRECQKLMENIEEVLRRNTSFHSTILWSRPISIDFFDGLSEDGQFRVGILTLETKSFY